MNNSMKAVYRDDDGDEMKHAVETIEETGYKLRRPSPHHLKVGTANFYPTTGTITIDPATVHPDRGVEAFLKLLRKLYGDPKLRPIRVG